MVPSTPKKAKLFDESKAKRKEDALELALLLYDIYSEEMSGAKITNGQNNASDTKDK